MKTLLLVFICLFSVGFTYCLCQLIQIHFKLKQLELRKKRIQLVYDFRVKWLYKNHEVFEQLPTFNEMVDGDEEIDITSYISIDYNDLP